MKIHCISSAHPATNQDQHMGGEIDRYKFTPIW